MKTANVWFQTHIQYKMFHNLTGVGTCCERRIAKPFGACIKIANIRAEKKYLIFYAHKKFYLNGTIVLSLSAWDPCVLNGRNESPPKKREMKKCGRNFHCRRIRDRQKSRARQLRPESSESAEAVVAASRRQKQNWHRFFSYFIVDRFSAEFLFYFYFRCERQRARATGIWCLSDFLRSTAPLVRHIVADDDDVAVCFSFFFTFLHQEWNCFWLM